MSNILETFKTETNMPTSIFLVITISIVTLVIIIGALWILKWMKKNETETYEIENNWIEILQKRHVLPDGKAEIFLRKHQEDTNGQYMIDYYIFSIANESKSENYGFRVIRTKNDTEIRVITDIELSRPRYNTLTDILSFEVKGTYNVTELEDE